MVALTEHRNTLEPFGGFLPTGRLLRRPGTELHRAQRPLRRTLPMRLVENVRALIARILLERQLFIERISDSTPDRAVNPRTTAGQRSCYRYRRLARPMHGGLAVVRFNPSSAMLVGSSREDALDCFLASAAAQQSAAGANWAPVLALGRTGDVAYYVTQEYEGSLEVVRDLAAPLSESSMLRLSLGIVGGLHHLRTQCGRAHGNLKASNVLIAKGKPYLSNPAPQSQITAVDEQADLMALGRLLRSLTQHRCRDVHQRWANSCTFWQKLSSRLTDPIHPDAFRNLEAVTQELRRHSSCRTLRMVCLFVATTILACTVLLMVHRALH